MVTQCHCENPTGPFHGLVWLQKLFILKGKAFGVTFSIQWSLALIFFNCSKKENEMLTLSTAVKYSEAVKVHILRGKVVFLMR